MGQEQSTAAEQVGTEQISQELALKFAAKCFTRLELYCFKEVFRTLADTESGIRYWTEGTLCRFLELPDALSAGPVVYHMATMLGAFPFMSQAPCIVTMDAMLRVITLLTERYNKVLKRGGKDRLRLLFNSLAVYDRRASESMNELPGHLSKADVDEHALVESVQGFDIDQPANDDAEDDDEEDALALAALDSLDAIEAFTLDPSEKPKLRHSIIPADNFLRLVELLLLIAPLGAQESISQYSDQLSEDSVRSIRRKAKAILWSFGIETQPGVNYRSFHTIIPNSLPFLFNGLNSLFEHFLFEKDFDLSKRKSSFSAQAPGSPLSPTIPAKSVTSPISPSSPRSPSGSYFSPASPVSHNVIPPSAWKEPLLEKPGEILTLQTMNQLSFFIPPPTLFGRLYPLYSGSSNGFSLGSFENAVFTWTAPSLLLVSGTILPAEPSNSRERSLADSLPPRRYPSSNNNEHIDAPTRVTYGAYVSVPWKHTHRACIGDASTMLFQLDPVHDVFRASELSRNYLSYVTASPSTIHPGINFGTPLPSKAEHSSQLVPLGPVSLYLDAALEYAVFTHTGAGGGSFHPSVSPSRSRQNTAAAKKQAPPSTAAAPASNSATEHRRRRSSAIILESEHGGNWQDRFEIESLEVWGFGGVEEADRRRRNQEFEEREARIRKESIAGKGSTGTETDKEILRMAGLIGHGHEGGSMQ